MRNMDIKEWDNGTTAYDFGTVYDVTKDEISAQPWWQDVSELARSKGLELRQKPYNSLRHEAFTDDLRSGLGPNILNSLLNKNVPYVTRHSTAMLSLVVPKSELPDPLMKGLTQVNWRDFANGLDRILSSYRS
jgi:hypothetical protein